MEKPLKKATLVLWIIGGLLILGALITFGSDAGTAAFGLVVGLALGLIGWLIGRKRTGKAAPTPSAKVSSDSSLYDIRKYRVAGVTFQTGKTGHKSRQGILRHMYFKDPPYDNCTIVPKVYDFEGNPAIGLYVNGDENEQIGNIPAESVQEVLPLMDRFERADYDVYGGGDKSYGCVVFLYFKK